MINYIIKFQKDHFIVRHIVDYRGDKDEERDGKDYYIYGKVLSNNEERTAMYREIKNYSQIGVPEPGDTLPIWYSHSLSKDIFILRINENFPKDHFNKALIKGGIIIIVLVTVLLLIIFNVVKL